MRILLLYANCPSSDHAFIDLVAKIVSAWLVSSYTSYSSPYECNTYHLIYQLIKGR